ncbi:MAG: 4Fe-4S dicluster domain-containing protein [Clostridia bacterium]|nr:4Fe-4S dicluster domain-containing protein [Clostridia bacterium]
MAIPTSRVREAAIISIDQDICIGCGSCVDVCKDFGLLLENGKAKVSATSIFGCIGCGHCMAICPTAAIKIRGRTLSPDDLFDLASKGDSSDYASILNLLQRRRSIREFKDDPVEREVIDLILEMVKTAPMGIPPSDVHVLVLDSRKKVREFAEDFCTHLERMKFLTSKWFLALMRPFWGKENYEIFRNFISPCINCFLEDMKKGINVVNYDAPLAMYFYGSPYCDPADPIISATYAMIAAEALGLGTCMLGAIHPFIQNGKSAQKLREKYGIKCKSREGIFLIVGYPRVEYKKGIRRSLASINIYG